MAEAVDHAQVGKHPVGGDEVLDQLRIGRAGRPGLREGWQAHQAEPKASRVKMRISIPLCCGDFDGLCRSLPAVLDRPPCKPDNARRPPRRRDRSRGPGGLLSDMQAHYGSPESARRRRRNGPAADPHRRAPALRADRRARRRAPGTGNPEPGAVRRRLPVDAVPEGPLRHRGGARPGHRARPAGGGGAHRRRARTIAASTGRPTPPTRAPSGSTTGWACRDRTSASIACRATTSRSSPTDERPHPASLRLLELRREGAADAGLQGPGVAGRRAAADPAQAQPGAADRRLSPHPGAAGGRRPVVRHAPDRARARAARALAHPLSRKRPRRSPRPSPGGPSISSCGRWRCSCRASTPTTCRPACTRTAPACTACRRPRSRRCARRPMRNLHLVRPQIEWLADMLQDGRPYLLGGSPASPISPPITSSGSSRAGTSIAAQELDSLSAAAGLARPHGRDRPRHSGPTSIPTRRSPSPAPPSPRRRDRRSRRRATRSPASAPACGPADNAKDWVEGEVNFIDAHEIALLRDDPDVGRVAVHFPRLGYDWRRVA